MTVAHADDYRTMMKVKPTSRRRCHCGCESRATHMGLAGYVCMTLGCELFVRRWVKDWRNALFSKRRLETK